MLLTDEQVRRLEGIAKRLRRHIVTMIGYGTPGHLGGSCSIADIVAVLYFHKMRHKPDDPKWPQRDRFLLSKGHAVLAQYAALAELGLHPHGIAQDAEGPGLDAAGPPGNGPHARHRGLHRFAGARPERRLRHGHGGQARPPGLPHLLHLGRRRDRRGPDLAGLDDRGLLQARQPHGHRGQERPVGLGANRPAISTPIPCPTNGGPSAGT